MCKNITETHCDFPRKIQPFWRAIYKVRAEQGERMSAWAEAPPFQANKDTKIGPVQSLVLKPHGNSMTVDFSPPFPPVSDTFRFKYRLYYGKEGADDKMEVSLVLTHYVLDNLEEQTMYCVQVKASTERMEGQTSDPQCAKTMAREYSGKDLALIVTVVFAVCGICCFTGYMIYRNHAVLKRLLYPPFRMPYHMQEFLDDPPQQLYEATFNHRDANEHDDSDLVIELTVLSEVDQTCADPNLVPAEKT
ncbi:hypothetical protein GDO78_018735 [Eleutherodactylus coqui]|uniref:Fibronectin type-III domain-containing protein n=1 Tax=Eleutherodactylus coqui TaxID=57060 RepID=A0A8J6JUL5_ELECQ|nr:hypothetical protein GDO78_018735 [Eleutherodactylus coqui]